MLIAALRNHRTLCILAVFALQLLALAACGGSDGAATGSGGSPLVLQPRGNPTGEASMGKKMMGISGVLGGAKGNNGGQLPQSPTPPMGSAAQCADINQDCSRSECCPDTACVMDNGRSYCTELCDSDNQCTTRCCVQLEQAAVCAPATYCAQGGPAPGPGDSSASDSACDDCLSLQCAAEATACSANRNCLAIVQCASSCSNEACGNACVSASPGGVEALRALLQCTNQFCSAACG